MDAIEIVGQIEIGKLSLCAGDILVARYVDRIRVALESRALEGINLLVTDRDFEFLTLESCRGFAA